jgi:hypothetical protein
MRPHAAVVQRAWQYICVMYIWRLQEDFALAGSLVKVYRCKDGCSGWLAQRLEVCRALGGL